MRFRYDKSSKWLLEHHGDAILRIGGVTNIRSWRALFSDVVQPRQLPDGLIEAQLEGRPAPDLFLHAARTLGHPPAACLVVEDSPAGIIAAQAAGMRVIAFTGGSHAARDEHRARVAALRPDATIADMRDLPAIVRG